MKPGRVCIMLAGRQAGKKCVIVKHYDEGNKKERRFPHALVAGIERAPKKITKKMGKKRVTKRSKVKPFVKYVNYNHILPTRYLISSEIKLEGVTDERMKKPEDRNTLRKEIKKTFEERYLTPPSATAKGDKSSHVAFFFKKLRF